MASRHSPCEGAAVLSDADPVIGGVGEHPRSSGRRPAGLIAMGLAAMLAASPAAAAPLVLSDEQLDSITAGGLVAILDGSAIALGQNTLAAGSAELTIVDKKKRTIAKGKLIMGAATDGGVAFASTDAYASGADIVVIKTRTTTNADKTASISITKIKAVDIKNVDLPAPIFITKNVEKTKKGKAIVQSGNVATLNFNVLAVAQNTNIEVNASALALEGKLSEAVMNILAGAGP